MTRSFLKGRFPAQDGGRLERPASGSWIFLTFFLSVVLDIALDDLMWAPDFLALTLIFWTLRQPHSIGLGVAFLCGILMDAALGSVLGQQSLAYVTMCYLAMTLSRRLAGFDLTGQALHILPLLLISQIFVMLVRLWFDGLWPGWEWFLQSGAGALLWPLWARALTPRASRGASL